MRISRSGPSVIASLDFDDVQHLVEQRCNAPGVLVEDRLRVIRQVAVPSKAGLLNLLQIKQGGRNDGGD